MSIKPHLLENENVQAYCGTKSWVWVCTDKRLLKYRRGSGSAEQLHDISFDEISAISHINTGRNDRLGGYGFIAGVIGLVLLASGNDALFFGLIMLAVGAYLGYRWLNSDRSYFEFRGSGLLGKEPEEWKINQSSADDPEEIREFVRVVRGRL